MANKRIQVQLALSSDTKGLTTLETELDRVLKALRQALGQVGKSATDTADKMANDLGRGLTEKLSKAWDDIDFNPGEILGDGLTSLFNGGGVEGLFKGMFSSVSGDLSKLLTAGLGDLAGMASTFLGGGFGGKLASDLITTVGGDLANKALAMGGELIGDLGKSLGGMFGGGSISPEEALDYIEKATVHMEALFSTMDAGNPGVVALDQGLVDMAERMINLAHTAGMTEQEIREMILAIDPKLGEALLATASPAGQAASAIQELAVETQNFSNISGESEEELVRWARSVGMSEDQVRMLVSQLRQGEISASQFAHAISNGNAFFDPFIQGARDAAHSIEGFNQTLGQTSHGGSGSPSGPVIVGNINNNPPPVVMSSTMHSGGAVAGYAHSGLLVPRLYPDEVPLIARRGEFVVRSQSVTPASLPWLMALNTGGGSASPSSGGFSINAPLVEIHGNVLGSEDTVAELARTVESKLRDIAAGRYA